MSVANPTIHEVDFCAQMASAINQLISQEPVIYPFAESRVEGFGSGAQRRKRKDLRFSIRPAARVAFWFAPITANGTWTPTGLTWT